MVICHHAVAHVARAGSEIDCFLLVKELVHLVIVRVILYQYISRSKHCVVLSSFKNSVLSSFSIILRLCINDLKKQDEK